MANEEKKNIVHPHSEFDVMANLSMNEDTKKPFISYKTRIRWFRSVFPMGSVEVHYSRPKGPVYGRIPIATGIRFEPADNKNHEPPESTARDEDDRCEMAEDVSQSSDLEDEFDVVVDDITMQGLKSFGFGAD